MFLVLNKKKIYSYIITLSIVVTLFGISTIYNNNANMAIQTSSEMKLLPIYNVKTEDKKVAFTMNCAWSQ